MTDSHTLTSAEQLSRDEPIIPSWKKLLNSAYGPPLALVCLSVWLHAADSLIVATMLPSIVSDIGGAHLVAWSITLYLTASIVAGAASALLTMRFGLRIPMGLAATLFGLGCLLSAIAPTMPIMLSGRVLQGLGGGALVSMGMIATRLIFPSHILPKAMAATATLWGASAFLGPLLGGTFVAYANWRWGFAAFAAQAFALALWIALQKLSISAQQSEATVFPWKRLCILTGAVLAIAYAGVEVEPFMTSLCLLAAVVLFLWFMRLDGQSGDARMLPNRPFDIRHPVGAALLMVAFFTIATVTGSVFGTLLLTKIHGVSAFTAGYVLACGAFGWTTAAFLVSNMPERMDGRLIAIGMLVVTASLVGSAIVYPIGPIWLIAMMSFMGGAGFGMAWTFVMRLATAHAEPGEVQRVTNAITTIQRLGYATGAAFIGIIANALGFSGEATASETATLARWLFITCLPFAAAGLIAMTGFVRKR